MQRFFSKTREGPEIDLAETLLPWGSWFLHLSEEGTTLP